MKLAVGSKAPDWQGLDQNKTMHSSKDYKGTWVLLYFYPKDDTSGCTAQACGLRDTFSELKPLLSVIGVSPDDSDSHRAFAEKYILPFTLIADTDKTMISAYGTDNSIYNKRTSFLIDPGGVVVKIYEDIDCPTHAKQVLEDMKTLA